MCHDLIYVFFTRSRVVGDREIGIFSHGPLQMLPADTDTIEKKTHTSVSTHKGGISYVPGPEKVPSTSLTKQKQIPL